MRAAFPAGARTAARRRTRRARNSAAAAVFVACALAALSCRGGEETIRLTLVSGATPVANVEVRVLIENPPGGIIARRTDGEGRLLVPASLRGLRVQVGLDCDENACRRVSPARRIEGGLMTFDVSGGLNLNPSGGG